MRLAYACFVFAVATGWSVSGRAQITDSTARSLGLEVAWKSQVQLPTAGFGVVSSHLWAEPQNPRRFAVVQIPNQTIRVSTEELDKDGKPIGIDEAKKRAQQQAAKMLGRSDGFQVVEVVVPGIKLVVITSDGLVQTFDAETGKLIWAQACGQSNAPAFPGAVSPIGVSLIHGSDLYLLDWETGKSLMTQRLRFSSSNAIAVCNDIAFVSDFTGRVQAYGLGQRTQLPWSYVMQGRAVGRTANFADQSFCAISSDAGYVYIYAGGKTPSVYVRYETTSPLTGSLTADNHAFYVGSTEGLVSKIAVDDRLGEVNWELRLGTTVTAPPLVVGKQVYVTSEDGDLVAIDDETGIATWTTSTLGISQAITEAGGNLYCLSSSNQLVSVDAKTGVPQARTRPLSLSRPVTNQLNDRVYLISKYGQLQCLRPVGASLPTMIVPAVAPAGDESASGTVPTTEPAERGANESPFNFGAAPGGDPFGGATGTGAAPATDPFGGQPSSDPFGGAGSADPFGGAGGAGTGSTGTADPFGGAGNPFGGSGN